MKIEHGHVRKDTMQTEQRKMCSQAKDCWQLPENEGGKGHILPMDPPDRCNNTLIYAW